jgi:hypothetical protein
VDAANQKTHRDAFTEYSLHTARSLDLQGNKGICEGVGILEAFSTDFNLRRSQP